MCPKGFDVELRGFSFMGGRSLRLRDVPIVPGSPRIVVRGFAVMGGVEVKSRSSRSGREAAKAIAEGALGVVDAFAARPGSVPGLPPVSRVSTSTKSLGRSAAN